MEWLPIESLDEVFGVEGIDAYFGDLLAQVLSCGRVQRVTEHVRVVEVVGRRFVVEHETVGEFVGDVYKPIPDVQSMFQKFVDRVYPNAERFIPPNELRGLCAAYGYAVGASFDGVALRYHTEPTLPMQSLESFSKAVSEYLNKGGGRFQSDRQVKLLNAVRLVLLRSYG